MMRRTYSTMCLVGAAFGIGILVGQQVPASAQSGKRVFELRTATAPDRQTRDALVNRFRQWEADLLRRIGVQPVAFFVPSDSPKSDTTFVYIVAHESRQQLQEGFKTLGSHPEFKE